MVEYEVAALLELLLIGRGIMKRLTPCSKTLTPCLWWPLKWLATGAED